MCKTAHRVTGLLALVMLSTVALSSCQQVLEFLGLTQTYTVTYSSGGATGGTVPADSTKYAQGEAVTVLSNSGGLLKTGYSFGGWSTQTNGGGITYSPGQTFSIGDSNVTLYALWTALPSYGVNYDGNGNTTGSAPTDSAKYVVGASVTVAGPSALAKSGYSFVGWNTAANGSGTGYATGNTFAMPASNVTLYAQWTVLPTYTVSYNANGATGGSPPTDSNNYLQGVTVSVLGSGTLTKGSHAFAGWNTQANGGGTNYSPGQTFTMGGADVTLYAVWALVYSVSYDGNGATGGSPPTDANSYLQGAPVTVAGAGSLAKTGNSFVGWNTVANGSGTGYAAGNTFAMPASNVTLYAQWTVLPTYTVSYNGNGATSGLAPTDNNSYLQGSTVSVLGSGTLVRTGYALVGWNTQANGSGTSYTHDQTFFMGNSNVTLYAVWAPVYTVTYNGNGATSGLAPTDNNSYLQGSTVSVLGSGTLVRTGYALVGWNTQANGSGTSYTHDQTFFMGNSNVTLYAVWAPVYTVTYNGNGATSGLAPTDNNSYLQGSTVSVLGSGTLVRTGYALVGWNTQANGSGTSYTHDQTFFMGNSNVTLYAVWALSIETVGGNGTYGYSGDGGPAVSAELGQPYNIALDSAGNLYIADYWANRIRKVNTLGVISTVAGSDSYGGYSGDGGPAVSARLYAPYGLAIDSAGNIYIADNVNGENSQGGYFWRHQHHGGWREPGGWRWRRRTCRLSGLWVPGSDGSSA